MTIFRRMLPDKTKHPRLYAREKQRIEAWLGSVPELILAGVVGFIFCALLGTSIFLIFGYGQP